MSDTSFLTTLIFCSDR